MLVGGQWGCNLTALGIVGWEWEGDVEMRRLWKRAAESLPPVTELQRRRKLSQPWACIWNVPPNASLDISECIENGSNNLHETKRKKKSTKIMQCT